MHATHLSASVSNGEQPITRRPLLWLAMGASAGLFLFCAWLAWLALSG
jgi:hypothetical protein